MQIAGADVGLCASMYGNGVHYMFTYSGGKVHHSHWVREISRMCKSATSNFPEFLLLFSIFGSPAYWHPLVGSFCGTRMGVCEVSLTDQIGLHPGYPQAHDRGWHSHGWKSLILTTLDLTHHIYWKCLQGRHGDARNKAAHLHVRLSYTVLNG